VQHLGEPAGQEVLPATGTLLHLPQPPILTLSLHASNDGGALLTLFNASDETQPATVECGLVKISTAHRCDLFGSHLEALPVNDGLLEISIAPRQMVTLSVR
jgi:hypothetical protein